MTKIPRAKHLGDDGPARRSQFSDENHGPALQPQFSDDDDFMQQAQLGDDGPVTDIARPVRRQRWSYAMATARQRRQQFRAHTTIVATTISRDDPSTILRWPMVTRIVARMSARMAAWMAAGSTDG